MLNYTLRNHDDHIILELSGSLNINSADLFKSVVERLIAKGGLMINLEKISTITSTGLNVLVEMSIGAKNAGKRIIFLWPDDDLVKMAETLDYSDYLIFAKSVDEGITKLKFFTD